MILAEFLSRFAAELALFAGAGFLLFAVNDLAVDLIYFGRRTWRSATVYSRHRRTYASYYLFKPDPAFIAVLVPAWDEAAVIAPMLRATLKRLDYDNYRIFVGHYRNDPATEAAIAIRASNRSRSPWTDRPRRPTASTICTMPWSRTSLRTTARRGRRCSMTPRMWFIALNSGFSTD